jgi:hypothetical protein
VKWVMSHAQYVLNHPEVGRRDERVTCFYFYFFKSKVELTREILLPLLADQRRDFCAVRRGVFGINVKFQTWVDNLSGDRERFVALGFRSHRNEVGWMGEHKHEHEMSTRCRENVMESQS